MILAALLLLGTAAPASAAWITVQGQRILEITTVAGAQTPEEVAERISAKLDRLVRNPLFNPDRIVVREDPPYAMLGLLDGQDKFVAGLAVDDRAAKAAGTSRLALAERYRDQLRKARACRERILPRPAPRARRGERMGGENGGRAGWGEEAAGVGRTGGLGRTGGAGQPQGPTQNRFNSPNTNI